MDRTLFFITRKYPPARGGMEEFSFRLYDAYPGPKRLLALRRGQRWLPLFAMRALLAAFRAGPGHHVHVGDAMLAPLAPVISRLSGNPVTATVHGQDVTRDVLMYRRLLRPALRSMTGRLVAVSGFTARQVHTVAGIQPHVITNGVDVARFAAIPRPDDTSLLRGQLGLPAEGRLIVQVGRLVKRKGAAWFAATVLPELPPDVLFVVVGDGPERRDLEVLAASDHRMRLLGSVPDEVVDRVYSCADLFVAPNIHVHQRPEGYGIAPAEAAAARVPVLVADIEGLSDMAAECGLRTVASGDPKAWAAAVMTALEDPSLAKAARLPRSWDEVAADYARFFTSCANEGSRATRSRAVRPA